MPTFFIDNLVRPYLRDSPMNSILGADLFRPDHIDPAFLRGYLML